MCPDIFKCNNMANFSFIILKSKQNSDGNFQIKLRVYHNSEVKYVNTGICVKKNELNNGWVVKRPDREFLNTQLRKIYNTYFDRYNKVEYADMLSCSQLISLLKEGGENKNRTFDDIYEEYVSQMDATRAKSIKLYNLASRKFSEFCGEGFILAHLTPIRVNNYITYLKNTKLSPTSINIYITLLKVIVNYAVKMQYVEFSVDPFVTAKVPSAKKRDTYITVEQLRRIRDAEIDKYNVRTCRDIFMLTYYLAGMNLVDMLQYDFRKTDEVDYVRMKTRNTKAGENRVTFSIPPEAVPLIKKYMNPYTGRLVFGKYSSYVSCYNVMARKMGDLAEIGGVRHDFTLYSARKSFVQHGFDLGVPLSTLEYCIGQTMKDSRPIFNYVSIMKKHADAAIRKILDNLLGTEETSKFAV